MSTQAPEAPKPTATDVIEQFLQWLNTHWIAVFKESTDDPGETDSTTFEVL